MTMFPKILAFLFPMTTLTTAQSSYGNTSSIDLSWHAPSPSNINNLSTVINSTGVYGFIFNSSQLPAGVPYGTYDWCNMPHARRSEYKIPPSDFSLKYVEVIHRHHKRTPYAANTFPIETYPWYCNDSALYYYGAPYPSGNRSAATFWSVFESSINPFKAPGFAGNCEFPQITHGGLDDSFQHGKDLAAVYRDLLKFLPHEPRAGEVAFRVTNNVITSQVAGMVVSGMFDVVSPTSFPLMIQPSAIDSLEPTYSCPHASSLFSSYGVGSRNANWTAHLTASQSLRISLNHLSGASPTDSGWSQSWDHYFDNLSSRLCHSKPLPCNTTLPGKPCVTQEQADEVFRLGEYEYSYIYRAGGPQTLDASTASYGVWVAELAQHLRDAMSGRSSLRYMHNVAHDGSISRLLSILQLDKMIWPGMGSEVVFELWQKHSGGWYVRILWGGQPLRSSNPALGTIDMLPVDTLLSYFDGLVGPKASLIPGKCSS